MKMTDQKLTALPIRDFAKKIICDGHLYMGSKQGKRFYLLKPGILIDQSFIKKHATNQTVFEYLPVTDSVMTSQFQTLFRELKYLHFEKDLRIKTSEIVSFFRESFSRETHFLTFAMACYQEFCSISEVDLVKMHETDLHLFRKSLYSAAFAVIVGLTNDFYHYTMIKDFYNLSFGFDIGLCDSHYSYFVAEACNKENQMPGSGRQWMLSQGASEFELNVFLKHPEKSYLFFKTHTEILSFPELKEVTLYQHELSSGLGFPRGIPKAQVSSWEAVVILSNALVEIRDDYQFESDVLSFILSFGKKNISEIPVQKVYAKLCMLLSHEEAKEESVG